MWDHKALSQGVLLAGYCGQGPRQKRKTKLCPSPSPADVSMAPAPGDWHSSQCLDHGESPFCTILDLAQAIMLF